MTELQKDRLKDVALALGLLPFALALSPLLVLWWFWGNVRDCWEDHATRHARNEWLAKEARKQQAEISR